jgi:hypothetical protein
VFERAGNRDDEPDGKHQYDVANTPAIYATTNANHATKADETPAAVKAVFPGRAIDQHPA